MSTENTNEQVLEHRKLTEEDFENLKEFIRILRDMDAEEKYKSNK